MNDKDIPMLQVAAKAILVNPEGRVLILREADESYAEGTNAGRYHGAAGGRINPEEAFFDALRREVEEETGIKDVEPLFPVYVGEWWPTVKGTRRHIVAVFIVCKTDTKEVRLSEEHDRYDWISIEDIDKYDVLPPDPEALKVYAASLN